MTHVIFVVLLVADVLAWQANKKPEAPAVDQENVQETRTEATPVVEPVVIESSLNKGE